MPKLLCGYPIPCPYHTAVVDLDAKPVPTVTIPVTSNAAHSVDRILEVARSLGKPKRRKRKREDLAAHMARAQSIRELAGATPRRKR